MKITIELEEDDLRSVNEALFNAVDLFDLPNEEIIKYWDMLPEDIKLDAAKWGVSDTEAMEKMIGWFSENLKINK